MKISKTMLMLLAMTIAGCVSECSESTSSINVRQDASCIDSPCSRDGYRGPVTKPTRATLSVQRTGQKTVILKEDLQPGDEVIFGYCITSFKTQSGKEEFKYSAQLRCARKDKGGPSSDGKYHEIFLTELPHGQSGRMQNPLPFGETFLFSSHQCASNESIDLSIRLDELPNQVPVDTALNLADPQH